MRMIIVEIIHTLNFNEQSISIKIYHPSVSSFNIIIIIIQDHDFV